MEPTGDGRNEPLLISTQPDRLPTAMEPTGDGRNEGDDRAPAFGNVGTAMEPTGDGRNEVISPDVIVAVDADRNGADR